MVKETFVPVKGSLKAQGIESFLMLLSQLRKSKLMT